MAVRLSTGLVNALAGGGAGDGSLNDIFVNAVAAVFTGLQPVNADAEEQGDLLGYITVGSGPFVPGQPTNALNWEPAVDGICSKPSATEWSITPIASGPAGWIRVYDNAMIIGASTSAVRMDMSCGISSGDARWSPTNVLAEGIKNIVNSFALKVPKA